MERGEIQRKGLLRGRSAKWCSGISKYRNISKHPKLCSGTSVFLYITWYIYVILVGYKNNIHIPSISIAIWPKWTRFDRGHWGDFTLQCHRPYAPYRLRRRLLRTIIIIIIILLLLIIEPAEDNQWIQLKIMPIKGPVPTPYTIVQHSFRLTFRMRRKVISSLLFIPHARDVLIFLLFPHDYICAFLIVWKSNQL